MCSLHNALSPTIKLTPESCDFGEQHKRIRRSAELFTPGGQERVQGQVNRVINEGEVARQVSSHATRPAAPASCMPPDTVYNNHCTADSRSLPRASGCSLLCSRLHRCLRRHRPRGESFLQVFRFMNKTLLMVFDFRL